MTFSCHESDTSIHAYNDGELAGDDRIAFEQHLRECEVCARANHMQARFKAALRGHLPRPPLPVGLRTRIENALAQAPVSKRRWLWQAHPRSFTITVAAAAAMVLLVTSHGRPTQSPVLEQAISTFHRDVPLDVLSQSCSTISDWFRGKLDFNLPSHIAPAGARCQGGRLVNVRDHFGAYMVYQVPSGHRMGVMVFPSDDEPIGGTRQRVLREKPVYMDSRRGVSTAVYRQSGGLDYVFTADFDEEALARMVETAFLTSP
jgi:anti-sigma factor RsiW